MPKQSEEEWIQSILNDPHSPWKTKAAYFSYVRGHLRRAWSKNILKVAWKKNALFPVPKELKKNFHPSTKNVGECVFCNELFPGSKLQVDHINPSSCKDKKSAEEFLWHCLGTTTDNYQLTCTPCHKIKSHAESRGMTFEEAARDKKLIKFLKTPIEFQKMQLIELGATEEDVSNASKRKKTANKLLWQNEDK